MPDEQTTSSVVPSGIPGAEEAPEEPHNGRLAAEAAREWPSVADESAAPPALSGRALIGRGLVRWALMGGVRLAYRRWTRIAAHMFPEDSRRAEFATNLGISLPDSLNMSWITPHLAVGGRVHPNDLPRLAGTGVSRVVDTRSEHQDDERALKRAGMCLLYLPTPDTLPLTPAQLCEGARWINEQIEHGERVLVHCEHGVGRSVLLAAAALVMDGMPADEALRLIQGKRWQAAPNHRQVRRLQEFERALRAGEGCR